MQQGVDCGRDGDAQLSSPLENGLAAHLQSTAGRQPPAYCIVTVLPSFQGKGALILQVVLSTYKTKNGFKGLASPSNLGPLSGNLGSTTPFGAFRFPIPAPSCFFPFTSQGCDWPLRHDILALFQCLLSGKPSLWQQLPLFEADMFFSSWYWRNIHVYLLLFLGRTWLLVFQFCIHLQSILVEHEGSNVIFFFFLWLVPLNISASYLLCPCVIPSSGMWAGLSSSILD